VYYTLLASVVLAPVATACAQERPDGLTVEPTMVRGSAKAPVTIVEFSDYQ
jgi:protein-disulfide isomerase